MRTQIYTWKSKVWIYPSSVAAWFFVTVPKKESAEIKKLFAGLTKGWGSLPVQVTVGKSTWRTSIFPDNKAGTYIVPLKAAIRMKENIFVNESVSVAIEICL